MRSSTFGNWERTVVQRKRTWKLWLVYKVKEEKQEDIEYYHQGLAQRSFTRAWTLSDETEVRDVKFEDGLLTVELGKIVPEHHARKDYL